MSIKEPPFTIGLEEEYLLVDRETRALAVNPPEAILTESAKSWGRGTSAHQQVAEYDRQRNSGADHEDAVHAVVDILVENTANV